MCIRFSIAAEKEEIEEFIGIQMPFEFEPIYNVSPMQKVPVITSEGVVNMNWGEDSNKIHCSIEAIDGKLKRGLVPFTGFFTWKNQSAPAPIGFGDHKNLLKLTPYLFKHANDEVMALPVLYNKKAFFLLTKASSGRIKAFQPNEPFVIKKEEQKSWLEGGELNLKGFSKIDYTYFEVSSNVNTGSYNSADVIESVE